VTEAEATEPEERAESIGWLELFFDLVVVAAVAVLTENLHDHLDWAGVGRSALVYVTIWTAWSFVVFYANLAGDLTRTRTVGLAMLMVAVMVAAAPVYDDQRANVFAVAFLVLRLIVGQSAQRTGRILLSFPVLQFGGAGLPWLVSLWVPAPWKYVLWALALLADLLLVSRGDPEQTREALARVQTRLNEKRRPRNGRDVVLTEVELNRSHLDERLGLFVIIVLGEAVIQVIHAAAGHEWTGPFEVVAVAAFVLLFGLWWQTFAHGFTGAPHTSLADLPPAVGLPLHLVSTAGLVAVAAGLAGLLAEAEHHAEPGVAWLLAVGLALFYAVGVVAGSLGRASRWWILAGASVSTAYCLVLGVAGPHLPATVLACLAVLPGAWQLVTARGRARG